MDEFLTVAEVAELLKLNQQTVRNWINRGELREHRSTRATAAATSRPHSPLGAEHLGRADPDA